MSKFKTILAGYGRSDEEHWIIVDQYYAEYVDSEGDNLVFYSKDEAKQFIDTLKVKNDEQI
jgi:hypothetical protein